jgi:glycosyltransferase involved in cell wall biosynthesis
VRKKETAAPKVCVMMLCYNHEEYVGEAIKSVLAQTYRDFELHVIDDGSSDNSGEAIEAFLEDSRVRAHRLPKNTGTFGAKRLYLRLVEASEAKYVANLDSDDMWKPEKLERQLAALEEHPDCRACFTWDEIIHEEGAGPWPLPDDYAAMENRSRYEWFKFYFTKGNRMNGSSMLMERAVFLEFGGFIPEFRRLGDFYLWMLFTTKYSFWLLPEKLTVYRRHGSNDSSPADAQIQLYNEEYLLTRRLITEMDAVFFRQAFSGMTRYADTDDPLVLAAEQIRILLIWNRYAYDQIAIELYIANAGKNGFAELMEERYGFTPEKVSGLLRNCGLAAAFASKRRGYQITEIA